MSEIIEELVREITTTTGTGNITLKGALPGYVPFGSRCVAGDSFECMIRAVDAYGNPSGEWEAGTYTLVAANTIARTTVRRSSNNNQLVNFGVGTKHIYIYLSSYRIKQFALAPSAGAGPGLGEVLAPIPTGITDNSTVTLQRGTTYVGTLELAGRTNVTVVAAGVGPKPIITPGRAVTGWTLHGGNIYKANFTAFSPKHVSINKIPCDPAHYPNRSAPWLKAGSSGSNSVLNYNLPAEANNNMVGARACVQPHQSDIDERPVTAYNNAGSMTLGPDVDDGNVTSTNGSLFYLEGKLWMLDESNSWAYENGVLYVWTPDGSSPAGKTVWASPAANGINTQGSSGCTIDSVEIVGTDRAIEASTASGGAKTVNLKVLNVDIVHCKRGLFAPGSFGCTVDGGSIKYAINSGYDFWYGSGKNTVKNTTIDNVGMVGMPKGSSGAIHSGGTVNKGTTNQSLYYNNRVTNTCYHGIQITTNYNTTVSNCTVIMPMQGLYDGAGIYTGGQGEVNMNQHIIDNVVWGAIGRERTGIYLDDSANGVTVARNTVTDCNIGILMHNAYNNTILNNKFIASGNNVVVTHIAFAQNGTPSGHVVTGNEVISYWADAQVYNLGGGTSHTTLGSFNNNTYRVKADIKVFARVWDGTTAANLTFSGWQSYMSDDYQSVFIPL
jgi:parallel beta-helix repeat protein